MIVLLTATIVVATVLFRLPYQSQEAGANVWELFDGVIREVPQYFRAYEGKGEVREVIINNNKLYYTNTMTSDRAKDVIDYYYDMYKKPEYRILSAKTRKESGLTKRPDVIRFFEKIDEVVNKSLNRVYRKDGNGYGFVGYIDFGNKDFFDHYIDKGLEFSKSGNLDHLGVGKAVIAIEDTLGKTTVLNFWTGPNFNFKNFAYNPNRDAKGEDIRDVPRPYDGIRIFSTKEVDSLAKVRTAVYRSSQSVHSNIHYYLKALRENGWVKSKLYEEADVKSGENNSMLFLKKDREVNITFSEDDNGHCLVTAVERKFKG